MGSSRHGNSTRTRAARSVKSIHKSRRKPAAPRPSKLRTASGLLRDAERFRATGVAEQFRVSPTQAVREMRDGVPATALRAIRSHLKLINATAIVVGYALKGQNNGLDDDATDVLRRHVSDKLFGQILQINLLLGEDEGDDVEEGEDKNLGAES